MYVFIYLSVSLLLARRKTIQTWNLAHIVPGTLSKNWFFCFFDQIIVTAASLKNCRVTWIFHISPRLPCFILLQGKTYRIMTRWTNGLRSLKWACIKQKMEVYVCGGRFVMKILFGVRFHIFSISNSLHNHFNYYPPFITLHLSHIQGVFFILRLFEVPYLPLKLSYSNKLSGF